MNPSTDDWISVLQNATLEQDNTKPTTYQSYRFTGLCIENVTVENYKETLVESLAVQVEPFIPPLGSFETEDLQRYLNLVSTYETSTTDVIMGLSLADQIRLAFSDMNTSTICDRYPDIGLAEKRRYRCVAEYLIRQGELTKLRDENGKLIKKIGNMQKAVVLYKPLPKLLDTLKKSGLGYLIKKSSEEQKAESQET